MRTWILALIVMGACAAAFADESIFIYDPHGARDPFLSLVTAGGAMITYETEFVVSEMALEGIISDGGGRIAIINGNIVESGGKIGLYTVQGIEEDRVILLKDGETSTLQLKKEE
jgi:hypothetical protein